MCKGVWSMRNSIKKFFSPKRVKNLVTLATIALVSGAVVTGFVADPSIVAGDCDSNAIIRCGISSRAEMISRYNGLDGKGKSTFIHAGVNLSKASGSVEGYVTNDNRVVVGGKTVATNAYTYGRSYMAGSTQVSGGAYMRHPSVSFRSSSIPAFVYMENGTFKWAVIKSCGNPVKATPNKPVAKPSQNIVKRVTTDLSSSTDVAYAYGKKSVQANKGQTVRFISQASNSGNVEIGGFVSDKLPTGLSFSSGKYIVKEGGRVTKSGSVSRAQDGSYGYLGVLKPGAEVKLDIRAKYNTTSAVKNVACIQTSQVGKNCDTATVTSPPPPAKKPDFKIVKSVKKAGTNDEFTQDITVNPGQKVEYVIGITNTGNTKLTNMRVRDELPENVRYIATTTKLVTSYGGNKNLNYITGKDSVSIGDIPVGGTAYVFFQATAPKATDSNVKECSAGKTSLRNLGLAKPIEVVQKTDDAYIQTCKTTPVKKPGVAISKKVDGVDRKQVAVGQNFTYQVVVKNTGQVNLKNVAVGDAAPAGVTLKSVDKGTIKTPTTWAYTIPQLNVDQSMSFNIVGTVKSYKAGDLKNIACVNAVEVNPNNPNVLDACDDATVTAKKQNPSINIEKTSSIKNGVEGQEFVYTLVVKNTGEEDLKNAKVTDAAPAGIRFRSADKGNVASDGKSYNYTIPELKTNQTVVIKIKARIMGATGTVKNTACVDAPEISGDKDDCDDVVIEIKKPSVIIDKKVDGVERKEVAIGQVFTYQVKVTNNGQINLKNALVYDVAPAGVTLLSADQGQVKAGNGPSRFGVLNGTYWTYTIPELKIGESKTFNIKAVVKSYKPGDLKNIACVDAREVNPNVMDGNDDCDDAVVTVKKQTPKIDIEKTSSITSGVEGQEFTYKLAVKNTGQVDLKNAKVTDAAPAGIKFLTADKGKVAADGKSYSATIESLKIGQTVEISIKAKVMGATGTVKNTACVDAPEIPGDKDDCDDVVIEIKKPSVVIDKKVDGVEKKEVKVNAEFTYQLKVTNNGQVDLKNVSVRDAAPEGVTLISADKGTIDAAKRNLSYVIPELKAGQSMNINIKAVVKTYMEGNLVNTACVNTPEVNPGEPTKADDCDDATVTVPPVVQPPKFACEELSVSSIDVDNQLPYNVKFDAKASASDGAVIQGYIWNFGDGKSTETTGSSVNHSYTATGNYKATVQVKTSAGTTPISDKCSVVVKVTEKNPVIECKDLRVELSGTVAPIKAKFTVTAKVENAVIESYIFSFGDGSADVTSATNTTEHTYQKPGSYTASARIKTDKGITETGDCKVVIKADEQPEPPVVQPPVQPEPPVKPTPETPTQAVMPNVLPKTGAEAVAVMSGTGFMFGAARMYAGSRKQRIAKFLKR